MPVQVGTGYVDIQGDFSTLNKQITAAIGPLTSRFGKLGGAAAIGLGGLTAGAIAAGKALYEIGEAFDDAYDKIRVQTGATGKELDKLERSFRGVVKSVPTDFNSAGDAVAGLNQRLELTGKPLRRMSAQILELSRITGTDVSENVRQVTRLFGDWSIETDKQSKTLDRLFRLSQETGIAVGDLAGTLVQFGSPLRTLGLDFDFAAAMVARFEKEGVNVTTLMSGLRLAVANLSDPTDELSSRLKQLGIDAKEPADAVMQVFEAIENTSSTMKGNTLAFEVFGRRAGSDMAAAVREGRFELDELMKTVTDGDETIRRAGRANMDFTEQWQLFKNMLATELEPTASRVFEEIGEAMKDVRKVVTDKSLTDDEKISELMDMAADAISDAAPKIAEAGGKLGVELAKGLVGAFWESDLLGKLFIGAGLIRAVGGLDTLKAAGTKIGAPIGRALGAAMIAGVIISDWDEIEDTIKRSVLAPLFPDEFGEAHAEGFITKLRDTLGTVVEGIGDTSTAILGKDANKVKLETAWGDLIFNTDTGKVIKAQGKRLQDLVGETMDEVYQDLAGRGHDQEVRGQVSGLLDFLKGEFKDLPGPVRVAVGQTYLAQARAWRDSEDITRKEFRKIKRLVDDNMAYVSTIVPERSAHAAGGLAQNFAEMANAGSTAINTLMDATSSALDALKVTDVTLSVAKGSKAIDHVLNLVERRDGGPVATVPGSAPGDNHTLTLDGVPIAKVESDEDLFVLNRTASKKRRSLETLNAAIPRRADGGLVPLLARGGYPMLSGDLDFTPAMGNALSAMARATGTPIYVQEGGRTLAEQAAYYAAYLAGTGNQAAAPTPNAPHVLGIAADITPGQSAFGSVAGRFGMGFTVPGEPWHIQLLDAAAAGQLGPEAQKIARVVLEGPDGPLKAAPQAAADMVRKAANDYLAKQVPTTTSVGGGRGPIPSGGGSFDKSELAQLWSATGSNGDPNVMAAIALAESSGNPNADNGIARGLWQIIASTWSAYGSGSWDNAFVPEMNARAAHTILANQGLTAWDVYDTGAYTSFLKDGGLLKLAQGGSIENVVSWLQGKVGMQEGQGNQPNWISGLGGTPTENWCSWFVQHVMEHVAGFPHVGTSMGLFSSWQGWPYGKEVGFDARAAGDILMWQGGGTAGHVGIGIGGGEAISGNFSEGIARHSDTVYPGYGAVRPNYEGGSGDVGGGGGGKGSSNWDASKLKGLSRPEKIAALVDMLKDKGGDLNKAGRQDALELLKDLRKKKRQAEARQHSRKRKRTRAQIGDYASMSPYPGLIRDAVGAVDLADERLGDLQNINGLTDLPDLPSDDELFGPSGAALLEAYNLALGLDAAGNPTGAGELGEISAEIVSASDLLYKQVFERGTLLSGLEAARIRGHDMAGQERRAEKTFEAVDALVQAEERKKKPNQAKLRGLRLQRHDARSKLNALRAGQREVKGFISEQSQNLSDLQGTDHDRKPITADLLAAGYIDQMPLGRFGGAILDTQAELKRLAGAYEDMTGERLSMPQPEADTSDSSTVEVDRNGFLAQIQSPVFERFFQEAWKSLPRHHDGGIIGGPPGTEQPFVGLAGERVLTEAEQAAMAQPPIVNVTIVAEEGAGVDPERMRVVVNDEIATAVRNHRRGGTVGMRATVGGRSIG